MIKAKDGWNVHTVSGFAVILHLVDTRRMILNAAKTVFSSKGLCCSFSLSSLRETSVLSKHLQVDEKRSKEEVNTLKVNL